MGVEMMKKIKLIDSWVWLIAVGFGLFIGAVVMNSTANASAMPFHFTFHWYSPDDATRAQSKWTKSAYVLTSKTKDCNYQATAWGHCARAGRTGKVDVSGGHVYKIQGKGTHYLTNYLVEKYGTGNAAWIHVHHFGGEHASGTWKADR